MANSREIEALENRHRFEEICEPYGLLGSFPTQGTFLLPSDQLALTPNLTEALANEARDKGLSCEASVSGLEFAIPSDPQQARQAAAKLGSCLFELRHLHPERFLGRRPHGSNVPGNGEELALPLSKRLMQRVVSDDFMPNDKKPPVLDLFRSSGPYLASIDSDPLVLFDAASQIASHAGGVNGSEVLEALYTGRFRDFPISNQLASGDGQGVVKELKALLSNAAGDELNHVALCNSGAEANEVALRIASRRRPGRKKILSFEGAFHGRTMWALHSTWNPAKRLRFELAGFEACWVKWPRWDGATPVPDDSHEVPDAYFQRLGADKRQPADGADELERREFESLASVEEALKNDDIVAILIECMQSEGGDRWATERFFCRLRALALAYEVPFIVDEVQTGFRLGGPFFWHRKYRLPAAPDLVSSAKKCQVGAVISRWEADFPIEVNLTSVVRGLAQAAMVSEEEAESYETRMEAKLKELQGRYPKLVLDPRACGYSFAFDLPSPEHMQHFIKERLWRGYMVYGAGDRTLRFRMNTEMKPKSLEALFQRLSASLETLSSGADTGWKKVSLPDQADTWPPSSPDLHPGYRIVEVPESDYRLVRDALVAIENATYEPARQDDMDEFGQLLREDGSLCLVALMGEGELGAAEVAGMAFAFPLRCFKHVAGPDTDPMLSGGRVLYSADICVHPQHRGKGLGGALKHAQVRAAMESRDHTGHRRYDFMTGRNRIGATDAMQAINSRYGSWTARRLEKQYRGEGAAEYYRIPLCAPHLPVIPEDRKSDTLDLDPGLEQRIIHRSDTHTPSSELRDLMESGCLNGAIANKMSLCNFVTPGVSRAMEILRASAPKGLGHLVVSNGRAEMFDKGLRSFKFHRAQATAVLVIGPVHSGWTTAAARSIALSADDPENIFDWPTLADPTVDSERLFEELAREIETRGSDTILTVIAEPLYASTGRLVPKAVLERIQSICQQADVPLTLVENTTGFYRNGTAAWLTDAWSLEPDAMFCFPGGQLGLSFVGDRYYVPDKLTLISTWDGDEVSLARLAWELRIARDCSVDALAQTLRDIISPLGEVDGVGLFQSVEVANGKTIQQGLASAGIKVGLSANTLRFAPPLNITGPELTELERVIHDLC